MTTPKPSQSAMQAADAVLHKTETYRRGVSQWHPYTHADIDHDKALLALAFDAFAARAVEAEREACAKEAERHDMTAASVRDDHRHDYCCDVASCIRARGGAK